MSRLLTRDEAEKFKQILPGYEANNQVLVQFKQSNFVVIAGPAGAGKDTLRNGLIHRYPDLYLPILSTTTRPPRLGEQDGKDYHFREVEQIEDSLEAREFFQVALVHDQQVSCLHVDEIKKLGGKQIGLSILVVEIEKKFHEIKPDMKTIFLIPPDLPELKLRMKSARSLNEDEIQRRLQAAKSEIAHALNASHYYCLVTESVDSVIEQSHAYLTDNVIDEAAHKAARARMNEIMLKLDNG